MTPNRIRLITGLHIGGNDDTMKIGGIDNSVIKRTIFAKKESGEIHYCTSECSVAYHEQNKIESFLEPYIPGSSLKGKMRSLLEYAFGLIKKQSEIFAGDKDKKDIGRPIDSKFITKCDDKLLQKKAQLIITLFGESAGSNSNVNEIKITRAIFRDSFLSKESRKLYLAHPNRKPFEIKAENTIDRVKVTANPRFMERVPSGLEFDCEIVLRDFGFDDVFLQLLFKNTLHLGLLLLQNDYLGGGGSRGSGRVEFCGLKNLNENIQELEKYDIQKLKECINNKGNTTQEITLQQAIQKQQDIIDCQLELLDSDLKFKEESQS
ncbi:type III-A CRISPR-associated RAMP protein Csm3 [Helicobacter cetorum]|uniref:type III-A CRISPR-associated RAMP protein Csm3 n=1 Tax=Helicobacter cetorum TaxID=138563 RepID=UPI000CF0BDAF|nr:type III-A CRISPR-associated RAMP protein Csm3 [Helicobacter cetorum]